MSVEDYLHKLPKAVLPLANQIRKTIKHIVPEAEEIIKYGMPTYQIDGHTFLYFAVWKKHIGFYAVYRGNKAFEALVKPYRKHKDTLEFDLNLPLPLEVLSEVVKTQKESLNNKK